MKKLILFILLTSLFAVMAVLQAAAQEQSPIDDLISMIPTSVLGIITFLLIAWEIIARFKPTWKNYTVLNKIVAVLHYIDQKTHVNKKG